MNSTGKWLSEFESYGLSVRLYDDLEYVKPLWQDFEKTAALTPFQTTAWQYQWYAHIGTLAKVKPFVVVACDNVGPLFLMSLQIEQGVLRKLTWLGSDLNDYNCPIIADDFTARSSGFSMPDVWRQILEFVDQQPSLQYDYARLEKMPEQICGQANPMLTLNCNLNASHSYRTPMLGGWEAFYDSKRSKKNRSKDRYRRKKLSELGEVTSLRPNDSEGIRKIVDKLMEQKGLRFAQMGVANLFDKPGHAQFYRAIAEHERGLVDVSQLNVGDIVAATNLGLTFRNAYYYVLTSYELGPISAQGPGTAHMQDTMKLFCEKGYNAFDFTIGDEPYKMEWCEGKNPLYDHLEAATTKGWAALAYWSAFRSTKRYIKQTPALWNTYSKLRGVFAARNAG